MKSIVEKKFWKNYWKSKKTVRGVGKRHFFGQLFRKEIEKGGGSLLEIGGFPGHYSIYFNKYFSLKTTLIDYYIDNSVVNKLLKINGLKKNSISVVESDIFVYKSKKRYDYVTSFGFLEHFEDLETVISKHVEMTKDGGKVIIAIPNLLGFNGWIQKSFDPKTLSAHNLKSMEINTLKSLMDSQSVESYSVKYYGGLLIWLEEMDKRSLLVQLLFTFINIFGHVVKVAGFNSRQTSPYIVIIANK